MSESSDSSAAGPSKRPRPQGSPWRSRLAERPSRARRKDDPLSRARSSSLAEWPSSARRTDNPLSLGHSSPLAPARRTDNPLSLGRTPNPPQYTIGPTAGSNAESLISLGPPANDGTRCARLLQIMNAKGQRLDTAPQRKSERTPRAPKRLGEYVAGDSLSEQKPRIKLGRLAAEKIKISLQIENELYLTHPKHFDSFNQFQSHIFSTWRNTRVGPRSALNYYSEAQFLASANDMDWKVSPRDRLPEVKPPNELCWRFRMKTPMFAPARVDARHWRPKVIDLWDYLHTQCSLTCGRSCRTHIIIKFNDGLTLTKMKQVAQAIIYFEPAFEDLLPKYRRGNVDAKSNASRTWKASKSGLWTIENAETEHELLRLIQSFRRLLPGEEHLGDTHELVFDPEYAWNFTHVGEHKIEFRNAPACANSEETLRWAELVFSFVNAAFQSPTSELETYSNGIGGLWAYMERHLVPVVNEPDRMAVLWDEARRRQGGGEQIRKGKREQG